MNIGFPSQPPSWPFPEYNHGTPPEGYPDMDFLAPEYALESECTAASDMFSLGMVAFALYNTKPLFTNSGSWNRSSHGTWPLICFSVKKYSSGSVLFK